MTAQAANRMAVDYDLRVRELENIIERLATPLGHLKKHFLCFWFFGLMGEFWAIDTRVNSVNATAPNFGGVVSLIFRCAAPTMPFSFFV
jgi:hypothetical protein